MTCQNCNSKLSCGCQKRTASNGVSVCSTCIGTYEKNLKSGTNVRINTAPANVLWPPKKQ